MKYCPNKIAELLSLLLEENVSADADICMETCAEWTSLKHIEIIMMFEEYFGVSFDAADIPRLTSQKLLAAKVKELTDAA